LMAAPPTHPSSSTTVSLPCCTRLISFCRGLVLPWRRRRVEAEEEGDDAGVEEGMLVVIAFRDDATG